MNLGAANTGVVARSFRTTLMTSVSLMSLSASFGLMTLEANAQCVTAANVTTCSGDVSGGVPDQFNPVDTLIIENTTTVLGGRSIFLLNTTSPGVNVDADFSPQGLVNDPTGFGLNSQTGIGIRADAIGATADVSLTGDMTIQAGPNENAVTSLRTERDAGVLIESRGEMIFNQTGDVAITAGSQTVTSDEVAATDTDRFSGIALIVEPRDDAPADLNITRNGNLSVTGPQMTATANDAIGSNRVIVNNIAGSESSALYGLLGVASGDITVNNTGNITLNSGELTGTTSSIGGRAESVGAGFFMIGLGLPNRPNTPFAIGIGSEETPRSENVSVTHMGDIEVNVGTRTFSATSETQIGDDPSEAVVRLGTGFLDVDQAFGVRIDTPLNLDASFVGDISVNGGMSDVTANALAGPDNVNGHVAVSAFGTQATGALLRGETMFTENDTDNDGAANISFDGNIAANGGSVMASISGNGFAPAVVSGFPPPPDSPEGTIALSGGNAIGLQISNFFDETVISANPTTMGRVIERVSQIDLTLDGSVSSTGGDVTATLEGADLSGRFQGGRSSAFAGDGMTLNAAPGVSLTAKGGDVSINLIGSHGLQTVVGGDANGAFIDPQSNMDSTINLDFSATGGNATLTGDAGTGPVMVTTTVTQEQPSYVVGGTALGARIQHNVDLFNSEFQALTPEEERQIFERQLFYTGTTNVKGGDASANDPDAVAVGGEAIGLQAQFATNLVVQGDVNATGGSGTTRDGHVVGVEFDRFGAFFPGGFGPQDVPRSIRIEGNVSVSGQGAASTDLFALPSTPFFGSDFRTSRNVSAGVRANAGGFNQISVANGGTVTADGDFVHGIVAAGERTNVIIENGGSVLAQGAGASGIEVRPFQDISFAVVGQALMSEVTILVEEGGTVTSQQGTGINDDENRVAVDFTDSGIERSIETFDNQTTVDIAGTVNGGNGTAIDLGTGNDTIILHQTATINGNTMLGSGEDRFIYQGFVENNPIDGGDDRDRITVEIDTGMSNRFEPNIEVPNLTNFEVISKDGEGTLTVGGAEFANGPLDFEINNGLGIIDSDLPNTNVFVNAGGQFQTDNRVGNIENALGGLVNGVGTSGDFNNSGTFAPGNSIGTFTVNGDFVQTASGTLDVEIEAPNKSDLIIVDGTTTLDGTLNVTALGMLESYEQGNRFTIIDSAGNVSGTFATTTDNLPDLNVSAETVDGGDGGEEVQLTLVAIEEPAPSEEFSDKSIHPNAIQAGAASGNYFSEIIHTRARSPAAGGAVVPISGPAALAMFDDNTNGTETPFEEGSASESDIDPLDGTYAWITGYGLDRGVSGSATTVGYDTAIGGVAFGVDSIFAHDDALVTLGLVAGYSAADVNSILSSASVETWHLGAYASMEKNAWLLSGLFAYGFQDYDFVRSLSMGSTTANGQADGGVFSASFAASYDVAPLLGLTENKTRIAPLLRFDHVSANRDAFTETGAGVLNLSVASDNFAYSAIGFGFEVSTEIELANGAKIRPNADIRWEHALGDSNANTTSAITSVAGASFVTQGASESRDRAVIGAGVEMDFSDKVSAHINYDGTFSSGFTNHSGSAGLKIKF